MSVRQLRFPDPLLSRANEILDLLWLHVEPATARAMTKTAWKGRFRKIAYDLAELGRSDDDIVAAYHAACERTGLPIWSLRVVQDQLVRDSVSAEAGNDYDLYSGDV